MFNRSRRAQERSAVMDPDIEDLPGNRVMPHERQKKLLPLVLGAGDGRGFGGSISPAKLALADSLDPPSDGFELRVHGVGGSSAEQILEQAETVQVGGDGTAQFIRRQAVSSKPTVRWPLEGYWWGGLTSRSTTRASWVFLLPLMLCNLASWMLPAAGQPKWRHRLAGAWLPPVMRGAGYVLTLLLTASLATASMDTFGWQCASAAPKRPVGGHGGLARCLPGWLHWAPATAGPRLVVFALVPVLVVAAIGYACHRTLRAYEHWQLPPGLPGDDPAGQPPSWPLRAEGFWHGFRPVRRQQMLHLAGAAALVSLYLAIVPGSHPTERAAAVVAALILLVLPAVTLALPQAGRPGVNPHTAKKPDRPGFDWWCGVLLVLSVTVLASMLIARIWWQPTAPTSSAGLLPGDSGIWWGLTFAMGALLAVTAVLTAMARNTDERKLDRPFAAGFMAPLTLGLACVTGGIFAAGLNLLLPNLLIGSQFHGTGPATAGLPTTKYPLVLPVPVYGFMAALLAMVAMGVILGLAAVGWGYRRAWTTSRTANLSSFYDLAEAHPKKTRPQRWRIAFSWTKAQLPDHLGVAVTALSLASIAGAAVFGSLTLPLSSAAWVTTLAHTGQWLALAATVAVFGYTRQAFTDSGKRRQIGVLWDVGTFWPRACQPLAPPCYMERSVPETVNRLRRALRDRRRDDPPGSDTDPAADSNEETYIEKILIPELGVAARRLLLHQNWVLINGYSQGSPIAAAIIAQLPQQLRDKVSLVTVGCPLRRLYGRAFPAYFGQRCLLELADELRPPPDGQPREPITIIPEARTRILPETRWRNLIRPSDYIGSYVFDDPMNSPAEACAVDKRLLDPPRIIPARATTPPPIHEHSDYWPDPQTAIHTQELLVRASIGAAPSESAA
jgi:hypothetical protein